MDKTSRIVCCCSWGQVRSVGVRHNLINKGYTNVIACGMDKNSADTLNMLFRWADYIFVCGEQRMLDKLLEKHPNIEKPVTLIPIGHDNYGRYDHPALQELISRLLLV